MSVGACTLRVMGLTDIIDAGFDLLPARGKRLVACLFAVLLCVSGSTALRLVQWYGHEKGQEIVHELQIAVPTPAPTVSSK